MEIRTGFGWVRRRVRRSVPISQASEAVKWGRSRVDWVFVIVSTWLVDVSIVGRFTGIFFLGIDIMGREVLEYI